MFKILNGCETICFKIIAGKTTRGHDITLVKVQIRSYVNFFKYVQEQNIKYFVRTDDPKAGHRSTLAFLRFCVIVATGRRKHTQVEFLWIARRIGRISAFPINPERLDARVFTSMLPEIGRKSRTCDTPATDVIFERKHCSRRRRHTQVEITSPRKQLGNSKTITRNRWHDARIG